MKKIIFIDQNEALVKKVKKAIKHLPFDGVEAKVGNIFDEEGVIVSASNPSFSCGGGLDRAIVEHGYNPPKNIKKGNQRIGNIIWTITVDENIKANRELVKSALKFALANAKKDETLLISGLGAGSGSLDEDDFVWLFLASVIENRRSWGWGIKYTQKGGSDFYTGTKKYEVGKWLEEPNAPKDGLDCGVGLHLGNDFVGAGNYNLPDKIFFCVYNKKDTCGVGNDKVRVSKLLPLYICPRWLGYGVNGREVLKNINKKLDPEKYNPYQTTKLPSLKRIKKLFIPVRYQIGDQIGDQIGYQIGYQIRDQIGYQIRDQIGDQVRDQVWDQVGAQVRDQVRDQVWDQVGAQVWDQVGAQVGAQVRDQVGDQVWAQVRATSYCAVNLHFSLGIIHPFFDFLKLGIMIVFVDGKAKVFGKKGIYLGEYDKEELFKK